MIPYGRQDIQPEDIEAVVEILKSDLITQGPCVPAFEAHIKSLCKVSHAVATNSATSALHIACLALGLSQGDYLWTTPITFVASANCGLYCGAQVDFVDINPRTSNISVEALATKLAKAAEIGKLPKILVVVHMGGHPAEMEAISILASKYEVQIIEDASHAIGASYNGNPIGSCTYSSITVFSFHPVKIVTTGEGGIATTNSDSLSEKMRLLRSHGITRDAALMQEIAPNPWYYEQIDLGYNYRMTDIQAALGLSQLGRLLTYIQRRNEIAAEYSRAFDGLPITAPEPLANSYSAWHLYVIRADFSSTKLNQLDSFNYLRTNGIGVNLHYIPVHLQPYYQKLGFQLGDFPEAEKYYREAITLPIYPTLDRKDQTHVIDSLCQIV